MRFLVCGGRDFGLRDEEWWFIHKTLNQLITYDKYEYLILMHGAATGVDSISGDFAKFAGIPCVEFPAEWDKYGKSAGFIRNKQMLDEGKPDWVIAFPGGNGTKMMKELTQKPKYKNQGIKLYVVEYPDLSEDGITSLG